MLDTEKISTSLIVIQFWKQLSVKEDFGPEKF